MSPCSRWVLKGGRGELLRGGGAKQGGGGRGRMHRALCQPDPGRGEARPHVHSGFRFKEEEGAVSRWGAMRRAEAEGLKLVNQILAVDKHVPMFAVG